MTELLMRLSFRLLLVSLNCMNQQIIIKFRQTWFSHNVKQYIPRIESIYQQTNALNKIQFMTSVKHLCGWHWGAILRES
jgi:hypothetical protein